MLLIICLDIVVGIIIVAFTIWAIVRVRHDKGDHKDSGGTQVGGSEQIPFFAPANDKAGMYGEQLVNYYLRLLLRKDEYLLANLLIPLKNGNRIEVDNVLVSRKGIFCIETKDWVGHISGNDEDKYWMQEYDDPYMEDRKHLNPVKQNERHCMVLKKLLSYRFNIDNIVIFAELEDGWNIISKYAYTINEFKEYFRTLSENKIKPETLKMIYQILRKYVATEEELKRYREETKRRFN